MVAVPPDTPVTAPDVEFTVAIAVLLLLHVPEPALLDSVDVVPWQIVVVPLNDPGAGFTVTAWVTALPHGGVYVMLVVPPVTPYVIPVPATTVAIAVLALLHVPPAVLLLNNEEPIIEPVKLTLSRKQLLPKLLQACINI